MIVGMTTSQSDYIQMMKICIFMPCQWVLYLINGCSSRNEDRLPRGTDLLFNEVHKPQAQWQSDEIHEYEFWVL